MSESIINSKLEEARKGLSDWYSNTDKAEEQKYALLHAKWTAEKVAKNAVIRKRKAEAVQRKRKFVYWTDLGMNVGSELCESHFCVVIKELEKTAVVVPLSSVKLSDANSTKKTEENGYFKIGCIDDLPGQKVDVYAVVSQIKTVSKKRLTTYKPKGSNRFITMKLKPAQMDLIDKAIKDTLTNS